jgi:hypothetical protein
MAQRHQAKNFATRSGDLSGPPVPDPFTVFIKKNF